MTRDPLTDPQPGDVVRAVDAGGGVGTWIITARGDDLVSWEYVAQPWDGSLDDGDTPDSEAWASQDVEP